MQINRLTLTIYGVPYTGHEEILARSHVPSRMRTVVFFFFFARRWFRYFYIVSRDQRSFLDQVYITQDNVLREKRILKSPV